ncbi:MAG: response regulator [Phormidesmis sp.]
MSKSSSTILIAEDDPRTRQALTNSLQKAGYTVVTAADGQEALDKFEAAVKIDLVILDVLMPRLDGFQVCQALRETSDVPIIIATVLGSSADRIIGLEMGANDYIVKPFSTKELIARIRSILRRAPRRIERAAPPTPHHQILKVGQLTIDPITRKAYRGSHHLRLTEIEFRLIELLASRPGHIFSRGEILESLWGYDANSAADTKTVDVHISRLRIKLNDHTADPQFIITIRGRGYMFLVQR